MNPVTDNVISGKVGELLIQIKLLLNGIQAAPPILDSGNDLVAICGRTIKTIQVKTKENSTPNWDIRPTEREYDILALVELAMDPRDLSDAKIYLLSKDEVNRRTINKSTINDKLFDSQIKKFFPNC
jgi:hypothetical protein